MEFSPGNSIVKLCLQGMAAEEGGRPEESESFYLRAWNEATQDFEKFISAHFLAQRQPSAREKLKWLETARQLALRISDDTVRSALPFLYAGLADCYEALGDTAKAQEHRALAKQVPALPSDKGPFYHGTKADLKVGDLLLPGGASNYQPDLKMNHIYFTGLVSGAGLAAALARGEAEEHVYIVEPTGPFEDDPNVTNQKFPGNPTRSYRSETPLRIIGEERNWPRVSPEELAKWREKLANSRGEIIN